MICYTGIRVADGAAPDRDPTFFPLHQDDFRDMPLTLVFTADCDPLRDDGRDYVERIEQAGGRAAWINEAGLVHGYLRARAMSSVASESFDRIVLGIDGLGQRLWPYA